MTDQTPSNGDFDPADPIQEAWNDQEFYVSPGSAFYVSLGPSILADSLAKSHRRDQQRLLWLNIVELVPTLMLVGVGIYLLATGSTHPAALVAAVVLITAISCFMVISSVRHYQMDRRWNTSVRDQLARRLAQLNHRAWLYRNSGWWYFLPLMLAYLLGWYGLGGGFGIGLAIFSAVQGTSNIAGYWFARWHGRERYESEADWIQQLLTDFDRTTPSPN